MTRTKVIVQCGLNGCTAQVIAEFERGESQTREDPGIPDQWYPYTHNDIIYTYEYDGVMREDEETAFDHMDTLSLHSANGESFYSRCDRVVKESFDD